ncbi:MAG: putative collagen-binding domain-containing protein [Phycisphaerae bacterium]
MGLLKSRHRYSPVILLFTLGCISCQAASSWTKRVEIYKQNPAYWQYNGKPVLLLGGSKDDDLFQIPDLKEHLDLLKSVGGNYIRNTMSSRKDKGFEAQPFKKLPNGKYDLDFWNDEYWRRFHNMLKLTQERDIIVQIEVWATFDYYRDHWEVNPFNPKNNINYTAKETQLPVQVNSHPIRTENNFFWSVPSERNQKNVLKYQQSFVDKMLSYSLQFGNVLYCMDNETSVTPEWGKYWSEHIKAKAKEAGVTVHTTEMWDKWDLAHPQHNPTFDHPETYSFIEISQNNHQKGQTHWDNAQKQRARIAKNVRPLNNVKIYGADTGRFGNDRDGMERFWRNIFGGMASARFHRPDSGLGLSDKAQANIRSMRMLTDKTDIFTCEPHNDLLSDRQPNEAYCLANPGKQYAVYFPDGGEVTLDISSLKKPAKLQWLDIMQCQWSAAERVESKNRLQLRCPSRGYWAVLIQ